MTREQMLKEYQDAIDTFCKELNRIDDAHGTYLKLYCKNIPKFMHGIERITPIGYARFVAIEDVTISREKTDPRSKAAMP